MDLFLSPSYKPNPALLPGSTHSSFLRKVSFVFQKNSVSITLPLKSASNIFTDSLRFIVCFSSRKLLERCWGQKFFSLTSPSFFHPWVQTILSSFKCSGWNYVWIYFPVCFDCFLLTAQHNSSNILKICFNDLFIMLGNWLLCSHW